DQVYVKDTHFRYIVSNVAHAQFLGARCVLEVIGKTVFDFFPPELAQKYHAENARLIETGCGFVEELERSADRDGRVRVVSRTKRPLRDRDGRIVGLIGIARDVTERVQAEESLRIMHETQEKQVVE